MRLRKKKEVIDFLKDPKNPKREERFSILMVFPVLERPCCESGSGNGGSVFQVAPILLRCSWGSRRVRDMFERGERVLLSDFADEIDGRPPACACLGAEMMSASRLSTAFGDGRFDTTEGVIIRPRQQTR